MKTDKDHSVPYPVRVPAEAWILLLLLLLAPPLAAQRYIDLNKVDGDLYIKGAAENDYVGMALAGGDINGDGIQDLVVATGKLTETYQKYHYVFYGSRHPQPNRIIDLKTDTPDLVILMPPGQSYEGTCLAGGDVNGDGIDDVIIGEPFYPWNGSPSSIGCIYVVLGSSAYQKGHVIDLGIESPYMTIFGYQQSGWAGISMASGDINADGFDDVLIGAMRTDAWGSGGAAYVVLGSDSFPADYEVSLRNEYDLVLSGETYAGELGNDVKTGDINGDGIEDMVVASRQDSTPPCGANGSVYVIYGSQGITPGTKISVDDSDLIIRGEMSGEKLGYSLDCGDVNGDGKDDLVMGEPWYNDAGYTGGRVSVIFGADYAPKQEIWLGFPAGDITILPASNGDYDSLFGYCVACGDLGGDGLEDLLIASPAAKVNGVASTGRAYAIYGKKDFPSHYIIDLDSDSPSWKIDGRTDVGYYFWDGFDAIDVANDGMADICISNVCEPMQTGEKDVGAIHSFFGLGKPRYGEGKPGSGAVIPELQSPDLDEPIIGTDISISISQGLGGSFGLLFLDLEKGNIPLMGGTLLVDPLNLICQIPFLLSSPGGGPGTGSLEFSAAIPQDPILVVYPLFMQAWISDPGAFMNVSMTNGLQITFGNVGE